MVADKKLAVVTETPDMELLYPFYLDTEMSMAFAAALGGGVALEREEVAHDDLESSACETSVATCAYSTFLGQRRAGSGARPSPRVARPAWF